MDEFVVELDLIFGQFVIVGVYFVDELAIEVNQLFESLLQQASHTLFFALFSSFLLTYSRSQP